jgi:hypothetical protein
VFASSQYDANQAETHQSPSRCSAESSENRATA